MSEHTAEHQAQIDEAHQLFCVERGEIGFVGIRDYAAVCAERDALARKAEKMREALEWYAKDYNHELGCSQWDGGARARAALEASSVTRPNGCAVVSGHGDAAS